MTDIRERLVSAVILCEVAQLIDAVQPHARNAHDEAAVFVERQAEGPAADMRIDFAPDIIRRQKANDLPLPHAAIEIVLHIENHVLGSIDLVRDR